MSLTDTIITRPQAKERGLTFYFPGSTCKHGHVAKRYTTTGQCITCLENSKPLFNERKRLKNQTTQGKLRTKAASLRYQYDMSLDEYEAKLKQQDHKCSLCCVPFDDSTKATMVHVDHDHKTGKVRDLLCNNCNALLGYAGDDVERLKKCIQYLRRHSDAS